jgi:hypothetical protein
VVLLLDRAGMSIASLSSESSFVSPSALALHSRIIVADWWCFTMGHSVPPGQFMNLSRDWTLQQQVLLRIFSSGAAKRTGQAVIALQIHRQLHIL